ncbi:MAG: hypothetical protein Q8L78_09080 [Coxiellaceae bacterium]|nr:hypothetical protein [Coxiellaceae bacterium]
MRIWQKNTVRHVLFKRSQSNYNMRGCKKHSWMEGTGMIKKFLLLLTFSIFTAAAQAKMTPPLDEREQLPSIR